MTATTKSIPAPKTEGQELTVRIERIHSEEFLVADTEGRTALALKGRSIGWSKAKVGTLVDIKALRCPHTNRLEWEAVAPHYSSFSA
jgi:hypothetical protein